MEEFEAESFASEYGNTQCDIEDANDLSDYRAGEQDVLMEV
jgi:hypothetical protein